MFERDRELSAIGAWVMPPPSGGVVVIEGAPGIGKTSLLLAAQAAAREQGFPALVEAELAGPGRRRRSGRGGAGDRAGRRPTPAGQVGAPPARVVAERPVRLDADEVTAHPVEEEAVVASDDHHPRPDVELLFQHRQGVQVQVVGRLVEQQDVRRGRQHPQQLEAAPLPAGQFPDVRLLRLGAEAEALEQPARGRRRDLGDGVEHPRARRQGRELLPVDADGDGLADLHPPGVGLELAGEQPQQRGLAAAVGPHDAQALARQQREVDVTQAGVRLADAVRPDHLAAQAPGG
jgi:hypothetical protein